MEIVNKILEWPIIIQGALGSFLFWIIFFAGQKLLNFSLKKLKSDNQLGSFFGKMARINIYEGNFELSIQSFLICIYSAIHYLLKFIISVFIALILKDLIPIFSYVGYLFGIYFIFRSISYVTHFDVFVKDDKKNGIVRKMKLNNASIQMDKLEELFDKINKLERKIMGKSKGTK